jgi:xanthine dehydrogenase accessory factor
MIVLIRGGGDLASGVAFRLHHSGFRIVITELPKPMAVEK